LKSKLNLLRARSRDVAEKDDYGKRFLALVRANVIGQGVKLQSLATNRDDGKVDNYATKAIESGFLEWGQKGVCTVCGKLSWTDVQGLALESVARDGEILIRRLRGWQDNRFAYALQLIEADHLDVDLNKPAKGGNEIRLGVEYDKWDRPVAYHVTKKHPAQSSYSNFTVGGGHYRIPANEIIHPFITNRIKQTRGVPWLATPLFRLNMLTGYEDAELVAARTAASKMGFLKSEDGDGYAGDNDKGDDATIEAAEPGLIEQLPDGVDFVPWDPTHPTTAFKDFVRAILRGVSAGLGVSYEALANDLEGVSYSSIRQGKLDERDQWRALQRWTVENIHEIVFADWLEMSLTSGALHLPLSKMDKFLAHKFRPRGWAWVDPAKETDAAIESIKAGLTSLSDVAAERGETRDDILDRLAEDKAAAEARGLNLTIFTEGANNAGTQQTSDNGNDKNAGPISNGDD